MNPSSDRLRDAFSAFLEAHGLDDDWSVRFTADEYRAREMARGYRDTGHEVRVLPLAPDAEELTPADFDRFEPADHDPLQHVQDESCAGCLGGTHVVVTRPPGAADAAGSDDADPHEELVYE